MSKDLGSFSSLNPCVDLVQAAQEENGKLVGENSAVFIYLGINQVCMSSESRRTDHTIENEAAVIFLDVL